MRRLALAAALAACGESGGSEVEPDAPPPDAGGIVGCTFDGPPRTARKIVVAHPYDADGEPAGTYRVLDLDAEGELSDPGVIFEMGRTFMGEIAFTDDGQLGVVAQDDGTLGVFRLDDDGQPEVVHAGLAGDFHASSVAIRREGDWSYVYVLDNQWRKHGGGIYRLRIDCDGSLTELGMVLPAKLPAGLELWGETAYLAAADVGDSPAGDQAHALDVLTESWSVLGGAPAFPDDDHIVGSTAMTFDGRHFLIGDNQGISEEPPNRIAVTRVAGGSVTPVQVVSPILDPVALIASRHDDVVLVVSGYGDAVHVLDYDGQAEAPLAYRGEVDYVGASPQLPGGAVTPTYGDHRDLVLIAELQGVRRMRMEPGGAVTDLGLFSLGDGFDAMTGAIGVQP